MNFIFLFSYHSSPRRIPNAGTRGQVHQRSVNLTSYFGRKPKRPSVISRTFAAPFLPVHQQKIRLTYKRLCPTLLTPVLVPRNRPILCVHRVFMFFLVNKLYGYMCQRSALEYKCGAGEIARI